jgi:hypothetical protein
MSNLDAPSQSSHPSSRQASDAEQLVALRRALFVETSLMLWGPASSWPPPLTGLRQALAACQLALLVAQAKGQPLAFLRPWAGSEIASATPPSWHLRPASLLVARRGVAVLSEGSHVSRAGIKRSSSGHTANARAVALYRRHGFEIEGTRRSSMRVDGVHTDEYPCHSSGI